MTVLTLKEAAEHVRLKESTIYKKTCERSIPFVKLGGAVRFIKEDLDEWIAERRVDVK